MVNLMKLHDVSPELIEHLKTYSIDEMVEKHESFTWEWSLNHGDVEFLNLGGYDVLLPVSIEQHPNVQFGRSVHDPAGNLLILFVTDTTFDKNLDFAGRMAVCRRVSDTDAFITVMYHATYLIEDIAQI